MECLIPRIILNSCIYLIYVDVCILTSEVLFTARFDSIDSSDLQDPLDRCRNQLWIPGQYPTNGVDVQ